MNENLINKIHKSYERCSEFWQLWLTNLVMITMETTICWYLRNGGLFGRSASRKPFLSVQHIRNRKNWCSAYLQMDPEKWKIFNFSDESRFQIYANITRLVWRPRSKLYSRKYLQTTKYGGFSIMVLTTIKNDGCRVIVRCPNRLNSMEY